MASFQWSDLEKHRGSLQWEGGQHRGTFQMFHFFLYIVLRMIRFSGWVGSLGFEVFIIEQPHFLTECNFLNRLESNNLGKRKGGEAPPAFFSHSSPQVSPRLPNTVLTLCSELGVSEPRLPHPWKVLVLGTVRVRLKRSSDPFSWLTCCAASFHQQERCI